MDKATAKWVDHPSESTDNKTRVRVELKDGGGELIKVIRDQNSRW